MTTAVEETCSALLQAIDFEGKLCMEPMKSLECELVSEITGTRASYSVDRASTRSAISPPSRGDTSYTSKSRVSTSEGVHLA